MTPERRAPRGPYREKPVEKKLTMTQEEVDEACLLWARTHFPELVSDTSRFVARPRDGWTVEAVQISRVTRDT